MTCEPVRTKEQFGREEQEESSPHEGYLAIFAMAEDVLELQLNQFYPESKGRD